jgi:glycosyltransferase involved in cell wall biosynthesis
LTLGIVYHMPFWQTADGALWEAEGSFARYVESLAPYFDEILLAVPVCDPSPGGGTRLRAANVRLAALPPFPGPRQFYPQLAGIYRRLRRFVAACDVVHLRIPSPAAIFAFRLARRFRRPVFSLVVGDYRALLPYLPYRGVKKTLFRAYVALEERAVSQIARGSLAFANGAALREKHERDGARVFETKTTTLQASDITSRADTCQEKPVRLLTVSRVDPRKNLRVLPEAVSHLQHAGIDAHLEIIGPSIGLLGDRERDLIEEDARRLNVAQNVTLRGAVPLDRLMSLYREFDIFVLPTGPGEGIPRVLLEAMAAGVPVVTTRVAGITSLVTDRQNGLLVDEPSGEAVAAAVCTLVEQPELRQRIIRGGYETARAHTLDAQAASMMDIVARELGLTLARPPGEATPQTHTRVCGGHGS